MVWKARKHNPAFEKLLTECMILDAETGHIKLQGLYAALHVNIFFDGNTLQIPYSHLVWFLTHGCWPKDGYHVDHINNDPFDNRPVNLDESTNSDNQKKRRGRMVYRNYGQNSKYGYGIHLYHDKRDDRYYVRRYLSRGHGNGELKTINKGLGGFDTLEEAEDRITNFIEQIKEHGLDWMPESVGTNLSPRAKLVRKMTPRIRRWRAEGQTIQEIARKTDFSEATIHKVVKDMGIDNRLAKG